MISTQTLQFYPLFSRLNAEMLTIVSKLCREVSINKDEWLFEEGGEATHIYLIKEGSLSLTLELPIKDGGEQNNQRSSPMKNRELLGWSAVVGTGLYKFGAIANEPSTLIQIDGDKLKEFMADHPEYGYHILYTIAEVIGERLEFKSIQLLSLAETLGL